jgi:chromosomal replication initiation ATPase DnaA
LKQPPPIQFIVHERRWAWRVVSELCKAHDVTLKAFLSQCRQEHLVWLRAISFVVISEGTMMGNGEIAVLLRRRHHSNVAFGKYRVRERAGVYPRFKSELEAWLAYFAQSAPVQKQPVKLRLVA